jgi:pimeloyl-ACP methyl ester carboxylesterase
MTTIARTEDSLDAATAPSPATRGPIARVVAGSLLIGVVGAAVATLVAFPGAAEFVITGSTLLAFAVSWAMLAALSARLTSQPQRWAYVPAAVMGATGLGLIAFTPGNTALTDAGWVWPPVMFALACWMGVQIRRTLTGRARWLLYPVIGVLALASVGGFAETIVLHHRADSMAMPGTSYDIGGRSLHMHCTGAGTGSPTVVLESGLGEMSSSWARIQQSVTETTRVCAYDRAGQGWSDDADAPEDGLAVARDLHALLAAAGESGPIVLVGHSTGGVYAMTYAAQYPDDVAGLALLDSSTPYQFNLADYPGEYAMLRRGYAVAQSATRLGLGLLIPDSMLSSLSDPAGAQVAAFATSPRGARNARDEITALPAAFDQAKALHTLSNKPLVVLTATETLHNTDGWAAAQGRLAALSTNSSHRIADATHAGLLDDEQAAEASAAAITAVVTAVRTNNPVK